jgi:hypothetical protein
LRNAIVDGGQIVYVNQNAPANSLRNGTSWAHAYTDLTAAIHAAQPSTNNPVEIWVAKGTYMPTNGIDRSASFNLKSNMRVLGGFAGAETNDTQRLFIHRTVLSGDIGFRQQTLRIDPDPFFQDVASGNRLKRDRLWPGKQMNSRGRSGPWDCL